jgi:hypothetical protein
MKTKADVLMLLSLIAVILAGWVSISGGDIIGLAGTQWILIAIVLGIYGIYAKLKM